jgi:hypothetical protein
MSDAFVELMRVGDEQGEYPAVEIACTMKESDLPAAGGAYPVIATALSDGTSRVLVLYSIDPANVAGITSQSEQVARAIQVAAQTLG